MTSSKTISLKVVTAPAKGIVITVHLGGPA